MRLMLGFTAWVALALPGTAQDQERFLYVETAELDAGCAVLQDCLAEPLQTTRQLLRMTPSNISSFLGIISDRADMRDLPDLRTPSAVQICEAPPDNWQDGLEDVPAVDQAGTLRGLKIVAFDATTVKGPDGNADTFGVLLHQRYLKKFEAMGIKVVNEEEILEVPGQPSLSIRFSARYDDRGCVRPFRASLQLKQSVVLTRDPMIRHHATTWSGSVVELITNTNRTPEIAMIEVVEAFLTDWQLANAPVETDTAQKN